MTLATFAAFGARPAFDTPLHVAQVNLPDWDRVEAAFRGIFGRRYFANHGPLVRALEEAFAREVGVGHALAMTNGTVALMVLARALDLKGDVIVPAFTFPATVQALLWAGLTPVLCDVDESTHALTAELVRPLVTERTAGILGVHPWGRACDPDGLGELADAHGLTLFFDACHGIGCTHGGRRLGRFGAAEAFSFHATKVVNAGEGGCVTTDDPDLARRLRTIRNFHHQETFAPVHARLNGKMSEAQAALALLSLEDLPANVAANRRRYDAYVRGLDGVPGIGVVRYPEGEENNHQYVVVDVDADAFGLDRDMLLDLLARENVICRRHFYPGLHRMLPRAQIGSSADRRFPVTEALCARLLQLPNGQAITVADVERVCDLIRTAAAHGRDIKAAWGDRR